ncbi:HD-GYP domain-containing protein [Treponema zioleckii]|uniref:HD-GYP domain-containing protein n=1 Tax=Treponema zioleckii TaxID=331680 RepID=UPI00168BCCC5|nr:HD domain-containing phosphohydrolase [Treponema zioleckii]
MYYKLTRGYFQGTKPKVILASFIVWLMLLIIRITFVLTFSNLKRESNSVIKAVSGIYTILYKANLENDSFQEIRTTDLLHEYFLKHTSIRKALSEIPEAFFIPENMREVRDFFNLDTLKERLKDTDNFSADFKSRDLHGQNSGRWYRACLIVCKRNHRNEPAEVICGAQDVDSEVREHEEYKMMLERFTTELSDEVAEQTVHIKEIQQRIVSSLGDMIGSRDGNTGGHVKRTSEVMKILVDEIIRRNRAGNGNPKFAKISAKKGEDIIRAAPMHDLGKIFIDTKILCKPGKLTNDEYKTMKTHAEHSGEIVNLVLRDVEEEVFVNTAFNIARYHHERWDGLGYPEGTAGGKIGEGIPIEARIMSVADVYDALVSKRCYKEPMSFEKAYQIMIDGMGKQFDPDLKEIFIACLKDLERYYSENNG